MIAVSNGIKFENADNFILDRVMANAWHNLVKVENSDNGFIYGIHVNVTYRIAMYNNETLCSDWNKETIYIIDNVIRNGLTLIDVKDSQNVQLIEDFHYGANNFAKLDNSTAFSLNCEASRLKATGYFFNVSNNSKICGINFICYISEEDILFISDSNSDLELYSLNRDHITVYNFIKKSDKN